MKLIEKIAGIGHEKTASTGFQDLVNFVDERNMLQRSEEGRAELARQAQEAREKLFKKFAGMSFTRQDRPAKVKEIYRALKRDHPGMPAEMKARIAARQGRPGKQKQGPPYKAPLSGKR